MPRRLLYVMDPMEGVLVDKDTTFAFQLEGQRRAHEQYHCLARDLFVARTVPHARVRRLHVEQTAPYFGLEDAREVPLTFFDVVLMRKDPPFDMAYVFATHLLELVDRAVTFVMNAPRVLRDANEKLYALHFPDLIPPTIVTRSIDRVRAFVDEQGGAVVVKPIDGYGGRGIFLIRANDPNLSSLLETATDHGNTWTMAQRYIPEATQGDKRIILVDGEPVGAVLRVPPANEVRDNLHVGAVARKAEIDADDLTIIRALKPMLTGYGQLLAGLDVIGGRLTEVNITSPTGIRHIDQVNGGSSAAPVIDCVERKAAQ